MVQCVDDVLIGTITNTAAGLEVAWALLHDRIPSAAFDRQRRVRGPNETSPPLRDPEILGPYVAAQRAVRLCYHRLRDNDEVEDFWRSEATYGPSDLVEPLLLCAALAGIRRHLDRLDAESRQYLLVAERKLKPFWREPPPLRKCRTCQDNPAAGDRKDCWTCSSRRRTKRQVRIRRGHR